MSAGPLPQWPLWEPPTDVVKQGPPIHLPSDWVDAGCFRCGEPLDPGDPWVSYGSLIAHDACDKAFRVRRCPPASPPMEEDPR